MTEAEWLATTDVRAMLECYTGTNWLKIRPMNPPVAGSDRKLRLFAVACCRLTDPKGETWDEFLSAVSDLEKDADGLLPDSSRWEMNNYFHPDWDASTLAEWAARGVSQSASLLRDTVGNPFRPVAFDPAWRTPDVVSLAEAAYEERVDVACKQHERLTGGQIHIHVNERCRLHHARLGRGGWCICDCKPEDCPDCHGTGRVATGMLDPFRLGLVADALEEAGCAAVCDNCGGRGDGLMNGTDSPFCFPCDSTGHVLHPILTHLRSGGPKYRGMWSLDAVLGRV